MTITRKYYEALIDGFGQLTKLGDQDIVHYLKVKEDLHNLINRIKKFNLFELTFSEDFLKSLTSGKIQDLNTERIALLNELHYELFTCLHTKRLRYGGELMQYMLKLKEILFQLPVKDLALFNKMIKIPQEYYMGHNQNISNEQEKTTEVQKIKAEIKRWPVKRDSTKVKKATIPLLSVLCGR